MLKGESHRSAALAMLLLVAAACADDATDPGQVDVATVTVSPDTITVARMDTEQLTVRLRAADGRLLTGRPVVWSSQDADVAVVSAQGVVSGLSVGTTIIRAKSGTPSGTAVVHVVEPAPATLVILGDSVLHLERGGSVALLAVGRNANGEDMNGIVPTWSTSNQNVAWVSNTGGVVARRGGTAVITAEFNDRTASVRIRVPEIEWISVLPINGEVDPDGTLQATAQVHTPAGIRPVPVQWQSENGTIAHVDAAGLITGLRGGTAIIRASAEGVDGRALVRVRGPRNPLHAASVDGAPLPLTLGDTTWTDQYGAEQPATIRLTHGEMQFISPDRYTQHLYLSYMVGTVVRGTHAAQDSGSVQYDAFSGQRTLFSEVFPGRVMHAALEYAYGLPTGAVFVQQRIGDRTAVHTVVFRQ